MWVRIVHPVTGRFLMEIDFQTWTVRHKERGEIIDTPLWEHYKTWCAERNHATYCGTATGGTVVP